MSTPFRLLLPRPIYDAMLAQAAAELPNECCGLLAGRLLPAENAVGLPRARAERRYPLANAAKSPTEYNADPRDLIKADRDVRERALEFLAIYHSHPTTEPVPSRTDLARSYWQGVISFIISLRTSPPVMRGWWLTETDYREAEWELVEELADGPGSEALPQEFTS